MRVREVSGGTCCKAVAGGQSWQASLKLFFSGEVPGIP